MSFADRLKAKLSGKQVGPIPVVDASAPVVVQPAPIAKNENNFIPTKYGEELAHAVKTYLPRASPAGVVTSKEPMPDIKNESLFPSLGGGAAAAPKAAVKGWGGAASWAEMAREKPKEPEEEEY